MTRLLCTADLHLHEWPGLAPVDRLDDQARVLGRIIEVATEREVDAVLIAGDVFHRPNPTPATLNVFRQFAADLKSEGIDVLAITGNASHDIENADRFCALELFDDDVDVRRGPGTWTGDGVDVICLPSVPMANLVARANGGDRDEIHAEAAQMLVDVIDSELGHHRAMTSARGYELPVVVLGHWSVQGAAFPNGLPVDAAREPVLPLHALEYSGVDAVVMGHVHRYQRLAVDKAEPNIPVFYCGSPMPLDFGEAGYQHGVVILELGGDSPIVDEFVPIPSRPFAAVDVDAATIEGLPGLAHNAIVDALEDQADAFDNAIVRIRYTATSEQQRHIDAVTLRKIAVEYGAALVRIQPEIVRADRARVAGLDEQLGELDAVQRWNVAQGVEAPHDVELVDLTRGYLETTVQA